MKLPHPTQVRHATAVLAAIWRRERPADVILADCFRQHREMGGRDRAHVSTLVYGVLRDRRRLCAAVGEAPEALIGGALISLYSADATALERLGITDAATLIERFSAPPPPDWAVQDNLPDWLAADWPALLPQTEWRAAAQALQRPATADFRVNRLQATRDAVLEALRARGLEALPTPYAPDGLRLNQRLPHTDPLLRDGHLIPQDEGSQWLVACLPLAAGQSVLDYCAGAGGKSLALAAALAPADRLRVTATDIDPARLSRLPPRARQAGAAIETRALPLPADAGFDGVLVDAPCSGSGTLRRAPELGLSPPDLAAFATLQQDVLTRAAAHVRPGGWLVYATCSLSPAENEAVADHFLRSHSDFTPLPLRRPEGDALPRLRLWPHRHGTDGFFAAGFRRSDDRPR